MPIPLQITYEDLEPTPAIEARIEREAAKLERFAHRINRCHVLVAGPSGNRHSGDLFSVHIRVTAPGHIDADADHAHADVQVAIRDAFNALRRRLQDRSRRMAETR